MDFLVRLLSYINLAGAIHALIQSMVLGFTRRGNRRANKFMAALNRVFKELAGRTPSDYRNNPTPP